MDLALAPFALPAAAAGAGAGGEIATAQVISLAARRGALEVARQAIPEVAKRAAAVVIIGAGGELLSMPPEATGPSIDLGLQLGINSSGPEL